VTVSVTALTALTALVLISASAASHAPGPSSWAKGKPVTHARVLHPDFVFPGKNRFPLKVSVNRRYLVDRNNVPFMIVGDSPQAMIGNLSLADAKTFIDNRKAAGFNTLLIDLVCASYTGCNSDATTVVGGLAPFTTPGNLATPNPTYFARADAVIQLAADAGMVVFLDPIETGGWLPVLQANGVAKDFAFGQWLGRRYARFPNLVWWHGNDFQTWGNPADDAVVLAVARGIASVDSSHLQTVLLNYTLSSSLDDSRWAPWIKLDAAYTYEPSYAEVLQEYNRPKFMPVFLGESAYEGEDNSGAPGIPLVLRHEEYWAMLSGATGFFYGNHWTWQFLGNWQDNINTPASAQVTYLTRLFGPLRWYDLVPDQTHKLVTAGYGEFDSGADAEAANYVTTAATTDGKLAVSYLPAGGTITVDMSKLSRPVRARWFDPTSGTFTTATGSPFSTSGSVQFTTPGPNAAGDPDWVLVLDRT
jgi:hypothetical protein